MRYLILADPHLSSPKRFSTLVEGVNSRLYEKIVALVEIAEFAKKDKIEAIFILGDIFDSTNEYVDKMSVLVGTNWIRQLTEICPVYILVGNHDIFKGKAWIKFLPCTVISEPIAITIGDTSFGCIPWMETGKQFVKALAQFDETDFILSHQGVEGAVAGSYVSDGPVPRKYLGDKPILSGHYHMYQTVNNITYIGSPLQQDFEEVDQRKGFVVLDTKKDPPIEFHENTKSPRFHIVEINNEADMVDEFLASYKKQDYYRIKINTPNISTDDIPSSPKIILRGYIEQQEFKEEEKEEDIVSPEALISDVIDKMDTPLDKDSLKQTALDIWKEVEK